MSSVVTAIDYPECDGLPMSDNTLQFQYIVTIQGGFDLQYADRADVFVAGDLLWYPVEGDNTIRTAPDILMAFGRPRGHRGSYRQWEEDHIPPQVVWEVLSPGNRAGMREEKLAFYERYGVEEYYQYDPDRGRLRVWIRSGDVLQEVADTQGWISPRTGVRMELDGTDLILYHPDGQRFLTYLELGQQRQEERERREKAEQRETEARRQREAAEAQADEARRQREAAEAQADEARRQREAAEAQANEARRQREAAEAQAEKERQQAQRLAELLRRLGIDPDSPPEPQSPP